MDDYLLDSNILIFHLRDNPEATALLAQWGAKGSLFISVATRTEILAGMRPHEEETTMALLDSLISLPVDVAIADRAGRMIYQYARQGITFSFADAVIAATALQHDLTLATGNSKHFPVPDLRVYPFG